MYARKLVLAATVLALGVLTGARAQADEERDASFYTSAFEKLATSNAETETADTTHTAATDIERVRTLIGQGQAYVAADKLDEAAPVKPAGAGGSGRTVSVAAALCADTGPIVAILTPSVS